jgi:hypothetical protein
VSDYLAAKKPPKPLVVPAGVRVEKVCPLSGLLQGPNCPNGVMEYFMAKLPLPPICDHHHLEGTKPALLGATLTLISPQNFEVYAYDPGLDPNFQNLAAIVKVGSEIEELTLRLNDEPLVTRAVQGQMAKFFLPLAKGSQKLTVLGLKAGRVVATAEAKYLVK